MLTGKMLASGTVNWTVSEKGYDKGYVQCSECQNLESYWKNGSIAFFMCRVKPVTLKRLENRGGDAHVLRIQTSRRLTAKTKSNDKSQGVVVSGSKKPFTFVHSNNCEVKQDGHETKG